MRDLSGLRVLALLWRIGALCFDAREICELRLHTITCLPSLYVENNTEQTTSRKTG